MSLGGGKYEAETTDILLEHGASAVLVIVVGGKLGPGFSVAATDPAVMAKLAQMLRIVADQIDGDLPRLKS